VHRRQLVALSGVLVVLAVVAPAVARTRLVWPLPRRGPLARLAWAELARAWPGGVHCETVRPPGLGRAAAPAAADEPPLRVCAGWVRGASVQFGVDAGGEVRQFMRSWLEEAAPEAAAFDSAVAGLARDLGPGHRCPGVLAHEWRVAAPYRVRLAGSQMSGGGPNWAFQLIGDEGTPSCG